MAPELREKNYKNAINYLRDVAASRAVLLDITSEATEMDKKTPEFSYTDAVFSRDPIQTFKIWGTGWKAAGLITPRPRQTLEKLYERSSNNSPSVF